MRFLISPKPFKTALLLGLIATAGAVSIQSTDAVEAMHKSEFSLLPPENATGNFTKIVRRVPIKIKFMPDNDLSLLRPSLATVVKVKVH